MLVNMDNTSNPLEALQNSAFQFYLTGSRFFGRTRPDSDYDFFCEDAEDIEEYLKSQGFRSTQVRETNYFGTEGIVKIYRNGIVDVHLVSNAPLKQKVQTILKEQNMLQGNKATQKQIWTFAMKLAEALKKQS